MRVFLTGFFFAVAIVCASAVTASEGTPIAGDDIKSLVEGRRIYLKVPLGGEFPLYYRRGGVVDGTGTAAGLGVLARVSDEGRWWVAGDQLCQQWQKYENGRRFCFRLFTKSDGQLFWQRDDGLSGLARVGR